MQEFSGSMWYICTKRIPQSFIDKARLKKDPERIKNDTVRLTERPHGCMQFALVALIQMSVCVLVCVATFGGSILASGLLVGLGLFGWEYFLSTL